MNKHAHLAPADAGLVGYRLLLERGADASSTVHSHGMTPLHLAAAGGHEAIVDVLLEAGAPLEVVDTYERTAAGWAARRGHAYLAKRLEPAAAPRAHGARDDADAPKRSSYCVVL